MYSSELDLPVHMHVHETAHEVDEAFKNNGMRPLQRLDELGLLNPNLLAVHMTQIEALEIERLAETGVNVVHCPESNLKLASGFCPLGKLKQQGVNVCLGTDGAASNNDLDMLGEMRTGALLAKGVAADASCCNAADSIRMATINGARALGLDQHIGSLEIGKKADIIAVDFAQLNTQPIYDPVAQLVYASNGLQVSHVWIDGISKLDNYQLCDIDAVEIITTAQQWQQKLSQYS
jgi:5-methylthioadenosine/S-adenosylhomocysteine deaminase